MINLQNYEEWFLLYTDNELKPAQKEMVEQFAMQHPDLQEALEWLKNTVLPKVAMDGRDWDSLLKQEESRHWEEKALLAIDDELDIEDKKNWENFLQENKEAQTFYTALVKTRLPIETVACPDKETLFKKGKKPLFVPVALRYAAVVAALICIVWSSWNTTTTQKPIDQPVVATTPPIKPAMKDRPTLLVQNKEDSRNPGSLATSRQSNSDEQDVTAAMHRKKEIKKAAKEKRHGVPFPEKPIATDNDVAHVVKPSTKSIDMPVVVLALVQKPTVPNIRFASEETAKTTAAASPRKRFVLLPEAGNDNKMFIANTEINTPKLFGWLKKNKFGKSKKSTTKLEIANFEIPVKTNQL